MLAGLFPDDIVTAWGDALDPSKPLFPEEEALVSGAVPKRKREFAKGRECARSALAALGFHDVVLLARESRDPVWPESVVGSITHTRGLCAAAVARARDYRGIGIDAEPAESLPPAIVRRVCREDELGSLNGEIALEPDIVPRLIFCAKEAFYKCVFPIARQFLGFEDVHVEVGDRTFRARLRVTSPPFAPCSHVSGRWQRSGMHLVAAAWISRNDEQLR